MNIPTIISWCVLGFQVGCLVMQIIFTHRARRNWKLAQYWLDKTKRLNALVESIYASIADEKVNDDD